MLFKKTLTLRQHKKALTNGLIVMYRENAIAEFIKAGYTKQQAEFHANAALNANPKALKKELDSQWRRVREDLGLMDNIKIEVLSNLISGVIVWLLVLATVIVAKLVVRFQGSESATGKVADFILSFF